MHYTLLDTLISSVVLFFTAGILTALGGLLLLLSTLKTDKIQRKVAMNGEKKGYELLNRYGGEDRLENIVVGSFNDYQKMCEIDALIHGKTCIISLEIKTWSGKIYPNLKDDKWKVENKSGIVYRRNPLRQSERHALILREFYPGAKIIPLVLILGWNEIEGEIPEGLITYKTSWKIGDILKYVENEEDIEKTNQVWTKIVEDEYSEFSEKRSKKYLTKIRKKYHGPRPWINAIIASICFLFVALAMIYRIYKIGLF